VGISGLTGSICRFNVGIYCGYLCVDCVFKLSLGICGFTLGMCVFIVGICVFIVGIGVFTVGICWFIEGIDVFTEYLWIHCWY